MILTTSAMNMIRTTGVQKIVSIIAFVTKKELFAMDMQRICNVHPISKCKTIFGKDPFHSSDLEDYLQIGIKIPICINTFGSN
jgi:hypothetical protein